MVKIYLNKFELVQAAKNIAATKLRKTANAVLPMALPFMEFQDQGYKTRKIFEKKLTYPKEIIEF